MAIGDQGCIGRKVKDKGIPMEFIYINIGREVYIEGFFLVFSIHKSKAQVVVFTERNFCMIT